MNSKKGIDTRGIPEYGTDFVIDMLKKANIKNFNDLVCLDSMAHGTGPWNGNADKLIENQGIPIGQAISNRDDIMNYLISKGFDRAIAFDIAKFIRRGKAERARKERYSRGTETENCKMWNLYKEQMEEHQIPKW